LFALVATAHYWRMKPSEFGLCDPTEDAAVMMAFTRSKTKMEAYETQLLEELQQRNTK